MSTPTEVADALDAAADYIEVHGWCQGAFRTDDGKVCAIHAIVEVASAKRAVMLGAASALSAFVGGVLVFNDEEGRTEFEVIDAMRLTAKDLRS